MLGFRDLLPPPPWEGPPLPRLIQGKLYYHGTSHRRLGRIKEEGLTPIAYNGKALLFLSPDFNYAADWGDVVVSVRLPKNFPVYYKGKEAGYDEYYTTEKIPPEYIVEVIKRGVME